jgi:hypothetical protein
MIDLLSNSLVPLVAQSATQISVSNTNSASWALVLFCVILGLLVALNPPRRTSEIKKPHE